MEVFYMHRNSLNKNYMYLFWLTYKLNLKTWGTDLVHILRTACTVALAKLIWISVFELVTQPINSVASGDRNNSGLGRPGDSGWGLWLTGFSVARREMDEYSLAEGQADGGFDDHVAEGESAE